MLVERMLLENPSSPGEGTAPRRHLLVTTACVAPLGGGKTGRGEI